MNGKRKMQLKNKILIGITRAEAIIALIAMSGCDSEDVTIPVVLLVQAALWLYLFTKANPEWGGAS